MTGAELLAPAISLLAKLVASQSATERQAGLIELQQILRSINNDAIALQVQNSSLLREKNELEQEVMRLKDRSEDRKQYGLRAIGPGVSAYVAHSNVQPIRDAEKLCPNCFGKAEYSPLQMEQQFPKVILACGKGCRPLTFMHFLDR